MGDRMTVHQLDVRPHPDGVSVLCSCGTWPEPVGGLANRRAVYPSHALAAAAAAPHLAALIDWEDQR